MTEMRFVSRWLGVPLILLAAECFASTTSLSPQQVAVIANPSNTDEKRILAVYEIPESLSSAAIMHAQLCGKVDAALDARYHTVAVEAVPVVTSWDSSSVSWTYPWTNAGGDVDESLGRWFFVGEGLHSVRIDVTDLVRQWMGDERSNSGVLLRASGSSGGTLSPVVSGVGGSGVSDVPVIKIWYFPPRD